MFYLLYMNDYNLVNVLKNYHISFLNKLSLFYLFFLRVLFLHEAGFVQDPSFFAFLIFRRFSAEFLHKVSGKGFAGRAVGIAGHRQPFFRLRADLKRCFQLLRFRALSDMV